MRAAHADPWILPRLFWTQIITVDFVGSQATRSEYHFVWIICVIGAEWLAFDAKENVQMYAIIFSAMR